MVDLITDRQFQIAFLVAIACIGAVYTFIEPFLVKDKLAERMKDVADYRERLRAEQRASFSKRSTASLRSNQAEGPLKQLTESLKLFEVFDAEAAQKSLMQAGFRGQRPVAVFMAARLGMPFVVAIAAGIWAYTAKAEEFDSFAKLLTILGGFFAGFYLPGVWVSNVKAKRQSAIKEGWPDGLDLLLICVESGMSIEASFQKVSMEIGGGFPELAEELGLTVAELSYLQERRQAYLNLADRTGLEIVKAVSTALVQSEKYGTPLGTSLRVLATESRELRMQEAEKKAAALPPKLTVPMILFFLPVLFAVILGPAILTVFGVES